MDFVFNDSLVILMLIHLWYNVSSKWAFGVNAEEINGH